MREKSRCLRPRQTTSLKSARRRREGKKKNCAFYRTTIAIRPANFLSCLKNLFFSYRVFRTENTVKSVLSTERESLPLAFKTKITSECDAVEKRKGYTVIDDSSIDSGRESWPRWSSRIDKGERKKIDAIPATKRSSPRRRRINPAHSRRKTSITPLSWTPRARDSFLLLFPSSYHFFLFLFELSFKERNFFL